MAYQKLQVGRATDMTNLISDVEDTVNLDNEVLTGRCAAGTTGTTIVVTDANKFIDANGNNLVGVGDLVVNTTTTPYASRITAVNSGNTITVQTTGLFASTNDFRILSQSDEAAVLYVGTVDTSGTVSLKVRTSGDDDITLHNVVQGTFLPVQVKRVYATGSSGVSNVVALF